MTGASGLVADDPGDSDGRGVIDTGEPMASVTLGSTPQMTRVPAAA